MTIHLSKHATSTYYSLPTLKATCYVIVLFWGLCISILLLQAFYRLCYHPLAGIPGRKLVSISNIWQAYYVRNGRMLHLGKSLHQQYGPAVRIGPNEVSFDSEEAFKMIYRPVGGFEKSDFYLSTALQRPRIDWRLRLWFPDTLDLLSERDISRYRLQRRLIGPVYHPTSLAKFTPALSATLDRVVARLETLDRELVDLKEWMHIVAVECLGSIVLSWSPGYLRDGTDWGSSAHGYLGWRRKSVFGLFPLAVKLELLCQTIGRLFAKLWRITYTPPKRFKPFFPGVNRVSSRRITSALNGKPHPRPPKDLLSDLIALHKSKPEFTETYLRRMTITNFGAGHETLCSALTSILAMLATHPDAQARVAVESRRGKSATTDRPYTRACIKEAMRLHPVIGMALPRVVPAGGVYLHGYFLPAGTVVGCHPAALHRNRAIFGEDANEFRPERWLGDEEEVRRIERVNLMWGGGARSCPGRNLAETILLAVVGRVVGAFEVEVEIPREEGRSYFLAMMEGVKVRFKERREDNDKLSEGPRAEV